MPRRIERRSDAKRMRPSRSGHDGLKTHDGTTADRPPFDRLKVNILCDGSLIRRPLSRLLTLALFHTVDRLVYQNGDSLKPAKLGILQDLVGVRLHDLLAEHVAGRPRQSLAANAEPGHRVVQLLNALVEGTLAVLD